MNHRPFGDEEEVLVLTTRQPLPRWLRWLLQALAALAGVALLAAAFIGWRYYSVQNRVKKDLAAFIAHEEDVRALGGINAAPDLIVTDAPVAWRYRYLASMRARKDRPIPDLALEKVDYDGRSARAYLRVDGVRQFRKYQLEQGSWRRAPFQASGWGEKQALPLPEGVEIIYWDEDEDMARALAEDMPKLLAVMQTMGLAPTADAHRLLIIPEEFGDLARSGRRVTGVVVNSPHVDLIPQEPGNLTPEEELRLALARKLLVDARGAAPASSSLPGAARVQSAIDEVIAWVWAVGGVSDAAVADWAAQLKGEWASPITGVPPNLITKLQPNAGEMAARLMMTYLLRKEGVDALVALNAALTTAETWDEAYGQTVGKTARQVEEAARALARNPQAPLPDWPEAIAPPIPASVTFLSLPGVAPDAFLARTADGSVITVRMGEGVSLVMADGSPLAFDCIASGSTLRIAGDWLDVGLQLDAREVVLGRAMLPPVARAEPMSPQAWALVARTNVNRIGASLVQLFPTGIEGIVAEADHFPLAATSDAPPLLVWSQATHCGRDWVLAYDPIRGVTGAWLAPASGMRVVQALKQSDGSLLLGLSDGQGAVQYVRTGQEHTLAPITETALKEAYAQMSPNRRWTWGAADNATHDALIVIDRATGESRTIYRSQDQDILPIQMVGGDPDRVYFLLHRQGDALAPWQVASIPWDGSGKIAYLFDAPSAHPPMLIMARCEDGGYLYSVKSARGDEKDARLRIHKADGSDAPVFMESGGQAVPLYCRGK